MEDDSKTKVIINWFLGAAGLGAVATAVAVPKFGIWLGLAIIVLALLIFGAYFLFRRIKARRQSRNFEGAIAAQTAASPRAISDPNRRAALDKLRQKFQTGMQEFKSRGKDIYKLPWYVIIGEPGSGKTEAIRHSGIDFPPGLQDELQGSGGTVNMDWWFTNRSIILDTAGSMIFNEAQAGEAPEWREFLRLLKKARPYCPINGFFLVLSVESLIKDSAETIAQKASKLAQQLDMIQRTLDVRFPVYLLVTKCDLLTGFREFFDNIEDPLLQHQIFGWSNPEPLDAHFRPDLIEQHLKIVAERVRRRRLGLLRESATAVRLGETQFFVSRTQPGVTTKRRLDEVDSLYALPESIMRLAPRLRRYLETIFVAGEWSAKPVFLRGIYFTSSMREGKALDEAMALATGVSLDQLPEDRPWEKNRSFFMRDLFLEKVFREYGLVTRATNTLKLLRQRKLLIFGVASLALLLLLGFSFLSYRSLNRSVLAELSYWNAGSTNWAAGEWSPPIVRAGVGADVYHFSYGGEEIVPEAGNLTVVQYHQRVMEITEKQLSIGWIFKPMSWLASGKDMNRQEAQRLLFEGGVLKPLVHRTRAKMEQQDSLPPALVALHREALLSLIRLEADNQAVAGKDSLAGTNAAEVTARYIGSFLSYLTDANQPADTNLVEILRHTYAGNKSGSAKWPPASLLGGNSLAANRAISNGLAVFRKANLSAQNDIANEAGTVSELADSLHQYRQVEADWQSGVGDPCAALMSDGSLLAAKQKVDQAWSKLRAATKVVTDPNANLTARYALLEKATKDASASTFKGIADGIPDASKTSGIFAEILSQINNFASAASVTLQQSYTSRSNWLAQVDHDQMALMNSGKTAYEARWNLYVSACALASEPVVVDDTIIGNEWKKLTELKNNSNAFRKELADYKNYNGPLVDTTAAICQRIAADADVKIQGQLVAEYANMAAGLLKKNFDLSRWSAANAAGSSNLLDRISRDLKTANEKLTPQDLARLQPVSQSLLDNAAQLRGEIGFPILLNARPDPAMSLSDLSALRTMLPQLVAALNDLSGNSILDFSSQTNARSAVQKLNRYYDVVTALVNPNGTFETNQLFFIQPTESKGIAAIHYFRQVDYRFGNVDKNGQEVANITDAALATGTVDGLLRIAFHGLKDDPSIPLKIVVDQPNWALLRMINSGQMQRSDIGTEWILKIPLEDPQQAGGLVEFKIVTARQLPKLGEWPKE